MALGAHPEASLPQRTGETFEQKDAIARWAAIVPERYPVRHRLSINITQELADSAPRWTTSAPGSEM